MAVVSVAVADLLRPHVPMAAILEVDPLHLLVRVVADLPHLPALPVVPHPVPAAAALAEVAVSAEAVVAVAEASAEAVALAEAAAAAVAVAASVVAAAAALAAVVAAADNSKRKAMDFKWKSIAFLFAAIRGNEF